MTIASTIQAKIMEAMKARDQVRLSTLRMLSSAFNYEKIEKKGDLSDEDEIAVIRKEAKKRKDAIESYKSAGSLEHAEAEQKELEILQEFLPPEMSEEDIQKVVEDAINESGASSMSDMGRVMGIIKTKAPDADGARVSLMVREKLAGK